MPSRSTHGSFLSEFPSSRLHTVSWGQINPMMPYILQLTSFYCCVLHSLINDKKIHLSITLNSQDSTFPLSITSREGFLGPPPPSPPPFLSRLPFSRNEDFPHNMLITFTWIFLLQREKTVSSVLISEETECHRPIHWKFSSLYGIKADERKEENWNRKSFLLPL